MISILSHRRIAAALLLLLAFVVSSCEFETTEPEVLSPVEQSSGQLATDWFELQMKLVQYTPGFTPPVSARALGYTGVTLYEAVVQGTNKYQSLAGQLNEMPAMPKIESDKEYSWPIVANAALASISRSLYANATLEYKEKIDSLENATAIRVGYNATPEVRERSIAHGIAVANAIFEWSKTDGGHEGYKTNFPASYEVPVGDGFWEPTSTTQLKPLQPYWGANRPFVLPMGTPNAETGVTAPPAWSTETTSSMYTEANEVYTTVKSLSEANKSTALYWADDPGKTCTPPGHSISILCQCMDEEKSNLEECAVGFAKLGIAMNDAFIACWETKFKYNLMRPLTYIQKHIDPEFAQSMMAVGTPSFPEYTSGHSVQSGAMAEVMGEMMGRSFQFTDNTHAALGYAPRTYPSFEAAAQEAAMSRLYGGIHFRSAIERGLDQGKKIGQAVNRLRFRK